MRVFGVDQLDPDGRFWTIYIEPTTTREGITHPECERRHATRHSSCTRGRERKLGKRSGSCASTTTRGTTSRCRARRIFSADGSRGAGDRDRRLARAGGSLPGRRADAKIGPDKDIPHISVLMFVKYVTDFELLGLL